MNQESLETYELIRAREYLAHESKNKGNLMVGILLIIAALFCLFFVGGIIKWILTGTLMLGYIFTKVI